MYRLAEEKHSHFISLFFFMLNIQTNVANLNQPQTKLRMRIVCKTFKCHLNCGVIICTHMTMKKKRKKKKLGMGTTYKWATINATYNAGRYSYYVCTCNIHSPYLSRYKCSLQL